MLALVLFAFASGAVAQTREAEIVDDWGAKPFVGKLRLKQGQVVREASENLSGAACTQPSREAALCLAVDDESQGVQLFSLRDGDIVPGRFIRLGDQRHVEDGAEKLTELDLEAVAYDAAARVFYVIGSHAPPRNPRSEDINRLRLAASSVIYRLPVAADGRSLAVRLPAQELAVADGIESSRRLAAAMARVPALGGRVGQPSEADPPGVNIEGLAARDGRLFIGLRAPSPSGQALVLEIAAGDLFSAGAEPVPVVHRVAVGEGRGIRDMTMTPRGLVVLAGPLNTKAAERPTPAMLADGAFVLVTHDPATGRSGTAWTLKEVAQECGADAKAETLLSLGEAGGKLSLLVLHESDEDYCAQEVAITVP
jgi:hypothetical protein